MYKFSKFQLLAICSKLAHVHCFFFSPYLADNLMIHQPELLAIFGDIRNSDPVGSYS